MFEYNKVAFHIRLCNSLKWEKGFSQRQYIGKVSHREADSFTVLEAILVHFLIKRGAVKAK